MLELVVNNFEFVFVSFGIVLVIDVNCGSVVLYVRGSVKVWVKVGVIMLFVVRVCVDCDFIVKFFIVIFLGSVFNKICVVSKWGWFL